VGQAVLLGVALAARVDVRPGLAALARGGAAALATGGLLAAPGLLTMFLGPQVVHGLIQPPDTYVTDVASLVVPDQLQLIAQAPPSRLMQHFFLLAGLLLACFVANAVLAGRRPAVRAAAGALAGLSLLVLAPMATPWVTPHVDAPFFSGPAARRIPAGSVALV